MKLNKIDEYLNNLKDKDKAPNSVSVLTKWIAIAEQELGDERAGRLSWLIASTVAVAKLQQVVDSCGNVCFVMKGGTMLQHRLGMNARASRDLDGIVTEELELFINDLDALLEEPWGNISFRRTPVEEIVVPSKLINPRKFELILEIKGRVWRRILVEISPDEAGAGNSRENIGAPRLSVFGIPTPDMLVGISLSYQLAQKIHAVTNPHNPPEFVNNRARDLVDILLLKQLALESEMPANEEIKQAVIEIFDARAEEAKKLSRAARTLPARVKSYPHWESDYLDARSSTAITHSLDEAVADVNAWLNELELFS